NGSRGVRRSPTANVKRAFGDLVKKLRDLVDRRALAKLADAVNLRLPGLAGRLAIVTGALVALAVGTMYILGVSSVRSFAEAQALTRAELAASAAREGLRQSTEDLLTAARILGERPALERLLRGSIREALLAY